MDRKKPLASDVVEQYAAAAGLKLDLAHLPGVARNLEILLDQADLLFETPLNPLVEPAAGFYL